MKQFILYIFSFCLIVGISSCNEDENSAQTEGKSVLSLQFNIDESVLTKTDNTQNNDLTLKLQPLGSDEQPKPGVPALEYTYSGLEPVEIELEAGLYKLIATVGNAQQGPSTNPYYVGTTNVELRSGKSTEASVICILTTVVIQVEYKELKNIYTDYEYETIVSTKGGDEVVFTKEDNDVLGYFAPGTLSVTFRYRKNENFSWIEHKMGDITDAKERYKYVIAYTVKPEGGDTTGSAGIGITINDNPEEKEGSIIIELPEFTRYLFAIEDDHITYNSATIKAEAFFNNGEIVNSVDLQYREVINQVPGEWKSATAIKKNDIFETELTDLYPDRNYEVRIKNVETSVEKFRTKQAFLEFTYEINPWSKFSFVSAIFDTQYVEDWVLEYRKSNSANWDVTPALKEGNVYNGVLSGLDPGVEYEYRLVSLSGSVIGNTSKFITQTNTALPYGNFDDWYYTEKRVIGMVKTYYPGIESDPFWDSGNVGANTASQNNPTNSESTIVKSGKSVRMKSQYIGFGLLGKFAAGNLYSGKYKETVGMSGAKLNFGRPYAARPLTLSGWYHYTPATINYVGDQTPVEEGIVKNQTMDRGHIWVALGDWSKYDDYLNDDDKPDPFAVRIDNSEPPYQLFDKNDEHIIAYGEFVPTTKTEGNTLLPFTIDLEYRDLNRIPKYIIVVASASKLGDYFTGGSESTLYIDEFELGFDYNAASFTTLLNNTNE